MKKGKIKKKAINRYTTKGYGSRRVKIIVDDGKNKETFVARWEMAEHVKKAIKAYKKGRIYRREVHEKARGYMEGRTSRAYKILIRRVARREKISKALPFNKETKDLGNTTFEMLRGARPIYEKIAKTLNRGDVTELVIANRSKVDRGLAYTLLLPNHAGEMRGRVVCRKMAPEAVAAFMEHIRFLSKNGLLPAYVETDDDKDLIWGDVPKGSRVKMEFNGKPSDLNQNLGTIGIKVNFTRPW